MSLKEKAEEEKQWHKETAMWRQRGDCSYYQKPRNAEVIRSWKRHRKIPLFRRSMACEHLDLGLLASRIMEEYSSVVLNHQVVVISYVGSGELITASIPRMIKVNHSTFNLS